ncbi:MAG: Tad domain-containing protein [Methylococcales bacterium]|nr:Tad domain-containing protein [Methylococcales bacterium]
MKVNCSKKQRGAIVPAVVIALPVLLVIMGIALDFAHVFVNKTRLQNALDATALSAAISINKDIKKDTDAAADKGIETFDNFKDALGNDELKAVTLVRADFEFSKTLNPWGTFDPAKDAFAFVKVTSIKENLRVTPWLISIFGPDDIAVPAISTAGPTGQNCSLAPFLLCADMPLDPDDPDPVDSDCEDGACYGYTIGQIEIFEQFFCKSQNQCTEAEVEAGNFSLLNLEGLQGGKDINDVLKGLAANTCANNTLNVVDTKSGRTWGPVRDGVNWRIDHDGGSSADYTDSTAYQDYQDDGGSGFRVLGVPIGDCRGVQQGSTSLPKVGVGCIFLTEHPPQGSPFDVKAQFIGSCPQNGVWDPTNPVLNGPYKIVLFKSPGSGDS